MLEGNKNFLHAHGLSVPVADSRESCEVNGTGRGDTWKVHLAVELNSGRNIWIVFTANDSDGEESAVEVAVLADDRGVPSREVDVVGVVETKRAGGVASPFLRTLQLFEKLECSGL